MNRDPDHPDLIAPPGSAADRLAETLQDAVNLLRDAAYPTSADPVEPVERGTLLQQCLAMCEMQEQRPVEALRTVHHLASTGGTLISKCLAAMPNVQLLSELDPLSRIHHAPAARPRFAPSDMVSQMRQSTRGVNDDLLINLFRSELSLVHADATQRGLRLVLRDHSHSHFCFGPDIPRRPTLLAMLPPSLPTRSIVTVREPIASFVSLTENKWLQFSPPTIDEYCRRCLSFLDHHAGLPIFRYEDFVAWPAAVMRDMCEALDLPFNDAFEQLFDIFRISGDSGRSSRRIAARGPRADHGPHLAAARESSHYRALIRRLGYEDGNPATPVASASS